MEKAVIKKMTKPRTKAAAAAPPALSLKAISKSTQSASKTPPTKEKEKEKVKIYSSDNFPSKWGFFKECMIKHPRISDFIGEEGMRNFHKLLDEHFFQWLNYRQNSQKMVYEIRHKFMCIAEAILFLEVAKEQRRLTPHGFVIGPFQKILENFAADIEPCNSDVIPYSRPLRLPLTSTLEDTQRQILEDDMTLAGVEAVVDMDDDPNFDASIFLQ